MSRLLVLAVLWPAACCAGGSDTVFDYTDVFVNSLDAGLLMFTGMMPNFSAEYMQDVDADGFVVAPTRGRRRERRMGRRISRRGSRPQPGLRGLLSRATPYDPCQLSAARVEARKESGMT